MFDALVKFLRHSRRTIILVIIVVVITLVASAAISVWLETLEGVHIPSIGTLHIIGFEAYGGDLKNKTGQQYFDWGRVDTGASTNRSFFIQSKINKQTTLNLTTGNWTFLRADNVNVTKSVLTVLWCETRFLSLGNLTTPFVNFMNVTWDSYARLIPPRGVVNVTLTMHVSSDYSFVTALYVNQVEGFSFDITIEPNGD